jgi:hypothetical protein
MLLTGLDRVVGPLHNSVFLKTKDVPVAFFLSPGLVVKNILCWRSLWSV